MYLIMKFNRVRMKIINHYEKQPIYELITTSGDVGKLR